MNRVAAIAAGLVLLAAAYGVAATRPTDELIEAPFASRGQLGVTVTSQHVIATAHDAYLAHEVELGNWRGTTSGIWFVAEGTIEATTEPRLVEADLLIDDVRYAVTSRVGGAVTDKTTGVGFPATGAVLIELPGDILGRLGARAAVLRISTFGDDRLDSVVDIVIDLTTLHTVARANLEVATGGAP